MGCASSRPSDEEDAAGPEPGLTVERSRVSALALASGVERQFSTTARARTLPGYKPHAALETQAEEEDAGAGVTRRGSGSLDPSAVLQVWATAAADTPRRGSPGSGHPRAPGRTVCSGRRALRRIAGRPPCSGRPVLARYGSGPRRLPRAT